jgi:hypothetical protein
MMRSFSAVARTTTALFSMMLCGIAFAQRPVRPTPNTAKPRPTTRRSTQYKTPADMAMIPYLKAHLKATSGSVSGMSSNDVRPMTTTPYTATPNFAGYVNAPNFPARNTASLAQGIFDTGVTAELLGDFNKDGKQDVAVIQEDGTLNILLGDGAGNLAAPVSYLNPNQSTTNVYTANVADINGDGAPDVVAFDYANNSMITWLNLGNGTFNAAVTTPLDMTYGYAGIVYVADVNGDGKADLIYTTTVSQSNTSTTIALEVQLGAGDGTFGTAAAAKVQQLTIPTSVQLPSVAGIAMADLNGDGKLDLVLGLPENTGGGGTWVVATMLGNGDGTFSTLGATQAISAPAFADVFGNVDFNTTGIYIADVNGDKKLDVVSDLDGTLYVALGNGDGTFGAAVTSDVSAIAGTYTSALLDLNGDGKLDWVTAGGTMGEYIGNGDGTFTGPAVNNQFIVDSPGYSSLLAADFNGDGITDIALLGSDYKQVSLFFGNGKTGLSGAPLITAISDPLGIDTDLVASGKYTSSGFSNPLFIYENQITGTGYQLYTGVSDGKGNFTSVQSLAAGVPADLEYIQPFHADFNGDGLEDLAYANATGDILVALSNGDGTFGTPKSIGLPAAVCPEYYGAAGDINGDGIVDLVIPYGGDAACTYMSGGAPSGYWVALGKGDGTFQTPVFTVFGTELYSVNLADLNGDGNLDLLINDAPLVIGFGFQVSFVPGNGDGTFNAANPTVVESSYVVSNVTTGDINGDGKQDIVLSEEEVYGSDTTTGGILTITGNGDGTFNKPSLIASGNWFLGLQTADMNNDGNPDIVATLYQTPGQPVDYYGMVTLLGYGNGQFTGPYNSLESLGSTLPLVGNFYNDGSVDVMTETGYGPALFIGQGGASLALTTSGASIPFGQAETLTATIAATLTGRPAATGIVSFYDGTTLLGTGTLNAGVATFTTASLATGNHSITAVYAGDGNYNPATSAATTVTVTALAPAFTLAGTPAALSLGSGANGVVTLNLAANASFSGAITLTCTGAPSNATCAINPGSVTLAAGQSGTATLVIGTTTARADVRGAAAPWGTTGAVASLAALCFILFGRRKRMRMLGALGLGVMLSIGTILTGCSGGGPTAPATGKTSFTVTVTATPASGVSASAQTTTIDVTVN